MVSLMDQVSAISREKSESIDVGDTFVNSFFVLSPSATDADRCRQAYTFDGRSPNLLSQTDSTAVTNAPYLSLSNNLLLRRLPLDAARLSFSFLATQQSRSSLEIHIVFEFTYTASTHIPTPRTFRSCLLFCTTNSRLLFLPSSLLLTFHSRRPDDHSLSNGVPSACRPSRSRQ